MISNNCGNMSSYIHTLFTWAMYPTFTINICFTPFCKSYRSINEHWIYLISDFSPALIQCHCKILVNNKH
ncbi:hypothetical protein Hanom_Chr09g00839031 [Helianthus anomalus]